MDSSTRDFNVTSMFVTFEKILCPFPSISTPFKKFQLNIVIAEKSFSHSFGYVAVFDSKCASCVLDKESIQCSFKVDYVSNETLFYCFLVSHYFKLTVINFEDNTCAIDGVCFDDNEINPKNCCEICSPRISRESFVERGNDICNYFTAISNDE